MFYNFPTYFIYCYRSTIQLTPFDFILAPFLWQSTNNLDKIKIYGNQWSTILILHITISKLVDSSTLFSPMEFFTKLHTLKSMMAHCVYWGVTSYNFNKDAVFLSPEYWFCLNNPCRPWWNAVFHLGLHCMPNTCLGFLLWAFNRVKKQAKVWYFVWIVCLLTHTFPENEKNSIICWLLQLFCLRLYIPVYSYGNVERVNSPYHVFFLGKLD